MNTQHAHINTTCAFALDKVNFKLDYVLVRMCNSHMTVSKTETMIRFSQQL